MSISKRCWPIHGIVCRSQNNIELFIVIILGGVDHSETLLEFQFKVKFQSLSI